MPRVLALLALLLPLTARAADPAQWVNAFTGTAARAADFGTGGGGGNTFPGAVAPFGMLAWSPDTVPGVIAFAGGYTWDDTKIRGFSLTHMSGPGCAIFQDVPILPTAVPVTESPSLPGTFDVNTRYVPSFDHGDEEASPGFYRVGLDPGTAQAIDVALAARTRSGVGRFTFPLGAVASVLFNAGGSAMANSDVGLTVDPAAQEVSGFVRAGQFCYHRNEYTLWFVARFERPLGSWGTWQAQDVLPGAKTATAHADKPFQLKNAPGLPNPPRGSNGAQAGAWVGFDATTDPVVRLRVGVSFTSLAGARANLDAESPDFDVDAARAATRAAWNEALAKVEVSGGSDAATRTFYTMLYHALLHPNVFSDADGTYAGMDGAAHTAAGFTKYANFSGWDVYRGQMPLVAMLFPDRASDMVSSLLADARESGWLPRWPVANGQTDVMVGDPAAAIIASAHALGATRFDTAAALAAVKKGATESGTSPNASYVERQALTDYLRLGWVPHDGTEASNGGSTTTFGATTAVWGSAATTLEYAVADFAIARFAAALGDRPTYRTFMRRSGNWRKLYNRKTGYLEPRYASGKFKEGLDPFGLEGFAEGNAAQYTWLVPFDPAGLFARLGGRRKATARLDHHLTQLNAGPESEFAFLGNEPELGVPWLYAWLGQPWKTQRVVREAATTLFDASPAGYVGNDDLGAMSAWHVFAALGFYPSVPATDLLVLASPLFPEAVVHLADGDLTIVGSGAPAPYVRSLQVDGRTWPRPWLAWSDARGARLVFELSDTPSRRWGSARRHAPPSFGPRSAFPR